METQTLLVIALVLGAAAVAAGSAQAQDPTPAPTDPGAPPLDPWQTPSDGSTWVDPGTGLPVFPGDPGAPLDPQPSGPPDQPPTGDPGGFVSAPGPVCGPSNPELCIPFAAGAAAGTSAAGGVWLPGTPNTWDNQIVYACNVAQMTDVFAPYVLKAILSKESNFNAGANRGDRLTCQSLDPQNQGCCAPYRGDAFYAGFASIGMGQINRCAHPDLASQYDLRDPNQNILCAALVLAGNYNPADWWGTIRAYNGSGPAAVAYANDVYNRARLYAQSAGVIPAS